MRKSVTVIAIDGVPRHYEWGSHTAIPSLLGAPPDGRPVAELWFGDHPLAPSPVAGTATTLRDRIIADPEAMLGHDVVHRFGARLPFLVKILAAGKPLSIQVHPNLDQATCGFEAEEKAGIALTAPNRNYRDRNHKPELLCALTPFDAMCGFRRRSEILALLSQLDLAELAFLRAALSEPDPLRSAFTSVLTEPDPAPAVAALSRRVAEVASGPLLATRLAAEQHSGDVGVLLTLFLNYLHLKPGECIYLDAGNVHAYLRGTAVEVMANSDNVLRCGLTVKHVDVDELLRITDFTELPDPRWHDNGGRFGVPVADFGLTRLSVRAPTTLRDVGPQIILCTSGQLRVNELNVPAGHAVFLPAGMPTTVDGDGLAFVAGVGAH
jgi:mannose-6-phosphate isomerase